MSYQHTLGFCVHRVRLLLLTRSFLYSQGFTLAFLSGQSRRVPCEPGRLPVPLGRFTSLTVCFVLF